MLRMFFRITSLIAGSAYVLIASMVLAQPVPEVKPSQTNNPSRILFVGNSYLYYGDSLHGHVRGFKRAADPTGKPLRFKSATISGATLAQHNIDWLTTPGKLGIEDPFELVVMQGGSGAGLSGWRRAAFQEIVKRHAAIIRSRGGEVALYMAHAYVEPNKRASPENLPLIESLYVDTGNAINALVIPVGLAFEQAYRRRPELPLHKAYDGSHPDLLGTYLAAATTYATIYGSSPVGNAYDYHGAIDRETATFLQQVAWDTVKAFFERETQPSAAK